MLSTKFHFSLSGKFLNQLALLVKEKMLFYFQKSIYIYIVTYQLLDIYQK